MLFNININAQIPEGGLLVKLHDVSTLNMNSITNMPVGALVYNTDEESVFAYNGSSWQNLRVQFSAGSNMTISGSGTDGDPYVLNSGKSTLIDNGDDSFTFSNGIDTDVTFTTGGSSSSFPEPFLYSINPDNMIINTTATVIITGDYFESTSTVTIQNQTINSFTVDSPTQITANITTGSTSGTSDVTITGIGGPKTLTSGFEVIELLSASDITIEDPGDLSYSGGTLTKFAGGDDNWNRSVYSTTFIPNNNPGSLQFTVDVAGESAVLGLDSNPTEDSSFNTIDFAFIPYENNLLYIFENGTNIGDFGAYVIGDILKIDIAANGTVTYLKNGSVIYTSINTVSGDLYFDTSFGTQGASYSNITLNF